MKTGRTTRTTCGRVNGLESVTRHYPHYKIEVNALEILICGYDTETGHNDRFSAAGESGSIVVDRMGRVIGLLTGVAGASDKTDRSYITPYYALKKEIEKVFPKVMILPQVTT